MYTLHDNLYLNLILKNRNFLSPDKKPRFQIVQINPVFNLTLSIRNGFFSSESAENGPITTVRVKIDLMIPKNPKLQTKVIMNEKKTFHG